jgi:hypothetical protein
MIFGQNKNTIQYNTCRKNIVNHEPRTGRQSLTNDNLVQKVEENICADRRVMISGLHEVIP